MPHASRRPPRRFPDGPQLPWFRRYRDRRAGMHHRCFEKAPPDPESPRHDSRVIRGLSTRRPASRRQRLILAHASTTTGRDAEFSVERATQLGTYRHQLNGIAGDPHFAEKYPAEFRDIHDMTTGSARSGSLETIHERTQYKAAILRHRVLGHPTVSLLCPINGILLTASLEGFDQFSGLLMSGAMIFQPVEGRPLPLLSAIPL